MDIPPLQPAINASQIPLDQLVGNPNVPESSKVKEACRQFEAVFLRQMLAEARKTVISSGEQDNTAITGIYDDMVNNQMADNISRSGAFGLAKSLQAQLVRQVLPSENADATKISSEP